MKKILMLAVIAISTNVFAQTNKTLVYCDYSATPQEDSVYMDLYFDLDAASGTFQNLEVGFLNAEGTGYPDYLYNTSSSYTAGATEAAIVATKDANTLSFNLMASGVDVNGVMVPAYQIGMTDGKVNGFDIVANGNFNGKNLANVTFTCYDPSSVAPAQQAPAR